jgi:anaerobic magnesium-protoporphyrin IX monomethyl ester cyclase
MADIVLIGAEEHEENLGMRSIAAYAQQYFVSTRVVSFRASNAEELHRTISIESPKIVGFSIIFQGHFQLYATLISHLRLRGATCHFTAGGHLPTLAPALCLEEISGLDSVVRGEGELTLLELFRALDLPSDWELIRGIAFRRKGEIVITPPRPLIENLDLLPPPTRAQAVLKYRGIGICSMLASRGCHYNCAFCSIQRFYRLSPGPRRRTRSPAVVADEMLQLLEERGVRVFTFRDDDLSCIGRTQREWIRAFAKELHRRHLPERIFWRISCRIDEVDRDILGLLMGAGLSVLNLGIESGNDNGLRTLNKRYSVRDIRRSLLVLAELGLPFEFGFMMFDPGSTLESLRKNVSLLRFIGEVGDVPVHFTKMIPYRGTDIADGLRTSSRLRGTIEAPDYAYVDERVALAEFAFHNLFRGTDGRLFPTAGRLDSEKLDLILSARFFPHERGLKERMQAIRKKIARYNKRATDAMDDILVKLGSLDSPHDVSVSGLPVSNHMFTPTNPVVAAGRFHRRPSVEWHPGRTWSRRDCRRGTTSDDPKNSP